MVVDLTEMKPGQTGVINELCGGMGVSQRAASLGFRLGKKVKKVSSFLWRGPQTVQIGFSRIAIGYGMAKKILVELDEHQ